MGEPGLVAAGQGKAVVLLGVATATDGLKYLSVEEGHGAVEPIGITTNRTAMSHPSPITHLLR